MLKVPIVGSAQLSPDHLPTAFTRREIAVYSRDQVPEGRSFPCLLEGETASALVRSKSQSCNDLILIFRL
jgi:hypothetical protein